MRIDRVAGDLDAPPLDYFIDTPVVYLLVKVVDYAE
jgi:hypothetical protein